MRSRWGGPATALRQRRPQRALLSMLLACCRSRDRDDRSLLSSSVSAFSIQGCFSADAAAVVNQK